MRNILHLRSSGALLGAENVIIELAKNTTSFGYKSFIGAIHNDEDPFPEFLKSAREAGLETVLFNGKGRADLKRLSLIRRFVEEHNIDIVHSHGYKEDFYSILLPRKIPKVATNHLWKKNSFLDAIYCSIDAFFLHFFDSIIGVSSEIVNNMRSLGIRRIKMIPNGIDCVKFKPQEKSLEFFEKFKIQSGKTVVGMISSLSPEKGHQTALKAMQLLSNENVLLVIVGDGALRDYLVDHVNKSNLCDRVFFAGKQNKIPEVLSVFDIFILPSLKEGLPMALLEAMTSEKVVIASRVGEIPEIITDKQNGLLINPENHLQLSEAIKFCLVNPDICQRMRIAARNHIVEKYSAVKMTENYCLLYDSVIKGKK